MDNVDENHRVQGTAPPLRVEQVKEAAEKRRLGKIIHYFAEIGSTNDYAFKKAQEGAVEGEVVVAEGQTRGKGRLGRQWVSPSYLNLYFSVILRPKFPPVYAPQLTLMSAVALAETIQSFVPQSPEIKWPNDIMFGGKKLAGILTESSCEFNKILFVIVGMGINLNYPRELMPEVIRETATSTLILTQKQVDRSAFMGRLIHSLDQCYGELEQSGFAPLARRWERFFHLKGKRVRIEIGSPGDRPVWGEVVGIDESGALLLKDDEGAPIRIVAGEVVPVDT